LIFGGRNREEKKGEIEKKKARAKEDYGLPLNYKKIGTSSLEGRKGIMMLDNTHGGMTSAGRLPEEERKSQPDTLAAVRRVRTDVEGGLSTKGKGVSQTFL